MTRRCRRVVDDDGSASSGPASCADRRATIRRSSPRRVPALAGAAFAASTPRAVSSRQTPRDRHRHGAGAEPRALTIRPLALAAIARQATGVGLPLGIGLWPRSRGMLRTGTALPVYTATFPACRSNRRAVGLAVPIVAALLPCVARSASAVEAIRTATGGDRGGREHGVATSLDPGRALAQAVRDLAQPRQTASRVLGLVSCGAVVTPLRIVGLVRASPTVSGAAQLGTTHCAGRDAPRSGSRERSERAVVPRKRRRRARRDEPTVADVIAPRGC